MIKNKRGGVSTMGKKKLGTLGWVIRIASKTVIAGLAIVFGVNAFLVGALPDYFTAIDFGTSVGVFGTLLVGITVGEIAYEHALKAMVE